MTPTRSAIAERGRLTADDHDRLARCRHDHTRLGLAYQIVFYRLTGRLPQQEPFEVVSDLVHHVAGQLALGRGASSGEAEVQADALVGRYADRPRTVYQHHVELREYLGVRPFAEAERDALRAHLRAAASHLERPAGLVARAEAYLRDEGVLLPAPSTLRRLVGEVRAIAFEDRSAERDSARPIRPAGVCRACCRAGGRETAR